MSKYRMTQEFSVDVDKAVLMEVIVSAIARRGDGTEQAPIRVVTQVFTTDGKLIAEYDPENRYFGGEIT